LKSIIPDFGDYSEYFWYPPPFFCLNPRKILVLSGSLM
jgi:hypothetical protein